MSNEEKIGKVRIDLSFHSEGNNNSDDNSLEELLQIAINHDDSSFDEAIRENKNWSTLYHLSQYRENIINWVPIEKTSRILEIDAECGAITGILTKKASFVHAIDSSYTACKINALRHQNTDNLSITVGDYKNILTSTNEKYDYITLLTGKSFEFSSLPLLLNCLSDNGRIILVADNKMGLRYLAGYQSDNSTKFMRQELENKLKEYGIQNYNFYYPYPDAVFPNTIFSDDYLPKRGELNDNLRNFDKDRYVYWNEARVFDNIIEENIFPSFSNSFLLFIGKQEKMKLLFVKISDNRDIKYQIITKIIKKNDKLIVTKSNKHPDQFNWINTIKNNEEKLSNVFGSNIEVLKSIQNGNHLEYEFISADDMETDLENASSTGNTDSIYKVLDNYYSIIRQMKTDDVFTMTDRFKEIFGDLSIENNCESGNLVNIDLLLPNIFHCQDKYRIIDCEWVFDFPIPLEYVFWRTLTFSRTISCLTDEQRNAIYDHYGLSVNRRNIYIQMENAFQNIVFGNTLRVTEYQSILNRAATTIDILEKNSNKAISLKNENIALRNEINNIRQSRSWKILKFLKIVK